jgi:glyoxylase-like metal-dependent hydrolase (beta-lactamase superfamily II)
MEVAEGVFRVEAPLGERTNSMYLYLGDAAVLLVDTGLNSTPADALTAALAEIGLGWDRVTYVLNTHSDMDHMGGNASVRELAPGARILCHELDRRMIEDLEAMIADRYGEFAADHGIEDSDETKAWYRANARSVVVDVGLRGGERIRLADDWVVEVIHTPGHTWGSVCLLDPRSRSVAIGDAVLWNAVVLADGMPAFPPTYRYVDTYESSIRRLLGLEAALLLPSHYPVQGGGAVAEFLHESLAFVDRAAAALREALVEVPGGLPLAELCQRLGPVLGSWPEGSNPALSYPLLGHLEQLAARGSVEAARADDGRLRYRWLA